MFRVISNKFATQINIVFHFPQAIIGNIVTTCDFHEKIWKRHLMKTFQNLLNTSSEMFAMGAVFGFSSHVVAPKERLQMRWCKLWQKQTRVHMGEMRSKSTKNITSTARLKLSTLSVLARGKISRLSAVISARVRGLKKVLDFEETQKDRPQICKGPGVRSCLRRRWPQLTLLKRKRQELTLLYYVGDP